MDWLVLRSLPINDPQEMNFLVFGPEKTRNSIFLSRVCGNSARQRCLFGHNAIHFCGLAGAKLQSGMTADGTT
jgi:hypothetical protein